MVSTLDRFQSIDPALLDIAPTDRVIDLGCGTGRHVLELSKIPADIIGADISRTDIRAGRYLLEIMRRRDEVKARVHWLQTAGERLPFKDGAFDRVICTETLEHVDDEHVLARELARVLKPGGILADQRARRVLREGVLEALEELPHARRRPRPHLRPQRDRAPDAHLRAGAVRRALPPLARDGVLAEPHRVLERLGQAGADHQRLPPHPRLAARARSPSIVTALDDIGNRILPKSIVVYSRKPLHERVAQRREHRTGTATSFDIDDRTTVEVRAVPAPFAIDPGVPAVDGRHPGDRILAEGRTAHRAQARSARRRSSG